jgi:molybdate/tungstate transport system ATP-binding protein
MISVNNLCLRSGDFTLQNISFEVPTGCYAVLMGRTACGKTMLLEAICGLKRTISGMICLHGQEVTRIKPAARGIGFVPQDGALFTTMTIAEHLAFPLSIRKWKRKDINQRVEELADMLGLSSLLYRKPEGLSGGERQRVALGRALSFRPGLLCLDEPLSALDEHTHVEICDLLKRVHQHNKVTTLHITHSQLEASRLADRTLILQDGEISEKTAI